MKDFNRRLNRLENEHGKPDDLPYLGLTQDLNDPELYHNELRGLSVREGTPEFDELAATHNLMLVEWAEAWPPGTEPDDYEPPPKPDDGTIVLTWGDE